MNKLLKTLRAFDTKFENIKNDMKKPWPKFLLYVDN